MTRSAWLVLVLAAGCDAEEPRNRLHPVDASVDAPIVQHDAGFCGSSKLVIGEIVDLESSDANFKGVNNLRLTLQGSFANDVTAPNGGFELCVSSSLSSVTLDVLADASATPPYHDGFVYLDAEAIANSTGFRPISLRAFDQERRLTFYQERGLTYDPTKAHVLVWIGGDVGSTVTLDRPHDETQYGDLDGAGVLTWHTTGFGRYVLLPNVDASTATGTLHDIRDHTIPLAADRLTLVGISYFLPI